jgi:orotate phosphoribosyltransferase
LIVGAPLVGRVVIVDDVITAGTAIRESVSIINANNATLGGIVVALDRLEKFDGVTAIAKIEQEFQTKVVSIITIDHIIEYLVLKGDLDTAQRIQDYKAIYCV